MGTAQQFCAQANVTKAMTFGDQIFLNFLQEQFLFFEFKPEILMKSLRMAQKRQIHVTSQQKCYFLFLRKKFIDIEVISIKYACKILVYTLFLTPEKLRKKGMWSVLPRVHCVPPNMYMSEEETIQSEVLTSQREEPFYRRVTQVLINWYILQNSKHITVSGRLVL